MLSTLPLLRQLLGLAVESREQIFVVLANAAVLLDGADNAAIWWTFLKVCIAKLTDAQREWGMMMHQAIKIVKFA